MTVVLDHMQRDIDGPMECIVDVRDDVTFLWAKGMSAPVVVPRGGKVRIVFDSLIENASVAPIRMRIVRE
jgi:hypothetical protein